MREPRGPESLERRAAWTLSGPAVVLGAIFIVVPFALAIALSFSDQRLVPNPNLPTRFIGVTNYLRLFADPNFRQAFLNTLVFTALVVPFQSAIALALAMLINSKLPARNIFRGIFFLPTVITMVVVCVVWFSMLKIDGFFNLVLGAVTFGTVGPIDWLRNPYTAMPAIVLLSAWQGFGFQMVIYLAGLQSISPQLYEAAEVDGATRWQQFWNVTMPSLRNTHIFVIVTTTILAFKMFTQVNILTQGGPQGATSTLVHFLYEVGFRRGRVGFASATAVVFFLVVLLITLLQRRLFRSDEETR
jgi:multiple sugar transport system permease protein